MRLTYFGHSSFLLQAQDDTRVIIDPYRSGSFDGGIKYAPVSETADVVIATHEHDDHGATDTVPGNPLVLLHPTSQKVKGVQITGVQVAHDEAGGQKRGKNTIVVVDDGDVRLAHLGDLGHTLDAATIKQIGPIDIVLVPVGGYYTIDAKGAAKVVDSLDPKIVVPMHYKTDKVPNFPITTEDDFVQLQKNVKHQGGSTLEVTKQSLPAERTTIVLEHAN